MKTKKILVYSLVAIGLILGGPLSAQEWRDIELRDVISGETFRISDFKGKTILLETFAVWCPTCTKQQQQIQILREEIGEEVVFITLDVDPNEEENLVRDHATRNGFDWIYAVAPAELTQALIEEFGTAIVIAPLAPIVLICSDADQKARLLKRGVKSADTLHEEIIQGCNQ